MSIPVVQFTVAGAAQERFEFSRKYAVIYDGHCKVCTRLSKVLLKWDRRNDLQVVPSQLPGVQETFPFIEARDYQESLQLIGPGMQRWQGAAAIEQLLTVLPRGILIGWIFHLPFVRPLADRFYRWFARNRYKLGCGEHCTYRPNAH
jgi:predicted DCC family thiol-disulfide oxidoreductase YuxK